MVWSPEQRNRLAQEKEILEEYYSKWSEIEWIDPTGDTRVDLKFHSNSNRIYKLRIHIPHDFPNSCPLLVVVQPKPLLLNINEVMPSNSHDYHTLDVVEGNQSICHYFPPRWMNNLTLYQVFMKGRLWIEAYEGHLSTGKPISMYLTDQLSKDGQINDGDVQEFTEWSAQWSPRSPANDVGGLRNSMTGGSDIHAEYVPSRMGFHTREILESTPRIDLFTLLGGSRPGRATNEYNECFPARHTIPTSSAVQNSNPGTNVDQDIPSRRPLLPSQRHLLRELNRELNDLTISPPHMTSDQGTARVSGKHPPPTSKKPSRKKKKAVQ